MWPVYVSLLAVLVVVAAAAGLVSWHWQARRRLYQTLAEQRPAIIASHPPAVAASVDPVALREEFQRERIVVVEGFLEEETFQRIREECLAHADKAERSFIPFHKKGGTLSYEAIHRHAPACLAFYHSHALRHWLSQVIGEDVQPTADHDQSSCSILYYDQEGDHINWHYDHNFYRGRHFTVLLSAVNRGTDSGGLSHGKLQRKRSDGEVVSLDMPENSLVVFEGARVLHRASPVAGGEQRVMLSMTFGTDPRIPWYREILRRFKDTAYYGPRILVD